MQDRNNQKVRTPSSQFICKLRKLIASAGQSCIVWVKSHRGFIIKDQSQIKPHLKKYFNSSFDGFKRYLKLLGFKAYKQGQRNRFMHSQLLRSIKRGLKNKNENQGKSVNKDEDQFPNQEQAQAHINLKSNLQEISLEMKLRSQEQAIENTRKIRQGLIEAYQRKSQLVQNFKSKYERCDALIDNVIYSLLMGHKQKQIDQESVLNQIAELQDIFSESHRDINKCVTFLARQAQLEDRVNSAANNNGNQNFNTGKGQRECQGIKLNSSTVLNSQKKEE